EVLALSGKFAETVNLGILADAAGIVELDGSAMTGVLTVDAHQRFGAITIDSGKGVNTLIGTADNDTFRFTSAGLGSTDWVEGGVGNADTIQIINKAAVTDVAFTHLFHIERLALGGGAVTGNYAGQKVTLGTLSQDAGLMEVDVLSNCAATLDATKRTIGVTF